MKHLLLCLPLLVGCYTERPLYKETPNNNNTYRVEYLFEHEGCKVYRFQDRGHWVYFTNCVGSTSIRDSVVIQNTTHKKG